MKYDGWCMLLRKCSKHLLTSTLTITSSKFLKILKNFWQFRKIEEKKRQFRKIRKFLKTQRSQGGLPSLGGLQRAAKKRFFPAGCGPRNFLNTFRWLFLKLFPVLYARFMHCGVHSYVE